MAQSPSLRTKHLASISWCSALVLLLPFYLCLPLVRATQTEDRNVVIGIDLGTTYSRVAIERDGHVEVIFDDHSRCPMTSWMSLGEGWPPTIEDTAQVSCYPKLGDLSFCLRQLIGQGIGDVGPLPFQNTSHIQTILENRQPEIQVGQNGRSGTDFAEEIIAVILARLKEKAENYLGRPVTLAVVAIPAFFEYRQRLIIKNSGTLAGLHILRVSNAPSAAAIAYGLDNEGPVDKESLSIVYDFGGGTLVVSLLSVHAGTIKVLGTAENLDLGGDHINALLVDHFAAIYKERTGGDIPRGNDAPWTLYDAAQTVKQTLSSKTLSHFKIAGGSTFEETLTRNQFEEITMQLLSETLKPIEQVLSEAGKTKDQIDHVILAGGSSLIPKVQTLVKDFFSGKQPLTRINPEEVVVQGAAIQGGRLSDNSSDGSLECPLDIFATPYTYSIQTHDGGFYPMIPRWTMLPQKITQVFPILKTDSTTLSLKIREEPSEDHKAGRLVGEIELKDVAMMAYGVRQVEVSFDLDEAGILKVTALDEESGRSASVQIDAKWPQQICLEDVYRDPFALLGEILLETEEMLAQLTSSTERLENDMTRLAGTHAQFLKALGPEGRKLLNTSSHSDVNSHHHSEL